MSDPITPEPPEGLDSTQDEARYALADLFGVPEANVEIIRW